MHTIAPIAVIVLAGWAVGWLFHRRSKRSMTGPLTRLASERGGTVEQTSFFTLPKLCFSYDAARVEVSSASTGMSGGSEPYTYVLFRRFDSRGFDFRIQPKSIHGVIDEKLGIRKRARTGDASFDRFFAVSTNDERSLVRILTDEVKSDLLEWAGEKPRNRISDIRNLDDGLIFCVYGTLDDYSGYSRLLDSAIAFHDALKDALVSLK